MDQRKHLFIAILRERYSMEDLDEHVRELKACEATSINSSSFEAQVNYLVNQAGIDWIKVLKRRKMKFKNMDISQSVRAKSCPEGRSIYSNRTELDNLVVTNQYFYWQSVPKYSLYQVETEGISYDELLTLLK